jgi:hypothetical protein
VNVARRIAARFALVYLVLYYLPFPGGYIPWTESIDETYYDAAYAFGGWVAQQLLGAPAGLIAYGGSGDKWVDWGLFVGLAVIAALITATWTAIDRLRDRPRVTCAMTWYVRWGLAAIVIHYGIVKVLPTQFTFPAPARMTENVGDMSPQGLLWTLMGASPAYVIFTGTVELLGGLLLLWRRTRLLGALVVAAAMTNVVMLNLCYDVTVKLMSMHLLLTALVLAAPDARRLAAMFVLERAVEAPPPAPVFASEQRRRLAIAAQLVLFALLM